MGKLNINPEKEPIPASWVPRVITGGKEPPDGTSDVWLERLELGTIFLAVRRGEWKGYLHELIWQGYAFSLLQITFPDDTTQDIYVSTRDFCFNFPVYEMLGKQETPDEGDNDERNRTD